MAESDVAVVASHEAGHALASWLLADADPAFRVSCGWGGQRSQSTCASIAGAGDYRASRLHAGSMFIRGL